MPPSPSEARAPAPSSAQRTQCNAFTAAGLDRASERRGDAAWIATLAADPESRRVVVDATGRVLAAAEEPVPAILAPAQRTRLPPAAERSLLGLGAGRAWFLERLDAAPAAPPGTRWLGLREIGAGADAFTAGLCAYACGLAFWQAGTRYCPRCGRALQRRDAGHRAECANPHCGQLQFPRTDPAIIVIVEHDGACLLGRQASWPAGLFSTLAGFVEPGESLADAVRREVWEEAGVRVADCDFHSSQPWPFPASLMLGFTARAQARTLTLRDGELAEARWFTPEDIARGLHGGKLRLSTPTSVSWHLIDHWLRLRTGSGLAAPTATRD